MKNKLTKIFAVIALVLIAPIGIILTGCGEKNLEIINIGLSKDIKTTYFVDESIDFNDAKLVLTYSDDSQKELTLSTSMIEGFDTSTAGEKTLKISYDEKEITINYTVSAITLTSIGLSKTIKTTYFIGESIDFNDAKLILTYNNNSQSELALSTTMVSDFDTSTAGEKTLKIGYEGKEITVNYTVLDFTAVYNKVADNLLAKDMFVANMRRYDETNGWYNYNRYTKYNDYFKDEDLVDDDSDATIYKLSTNEYRFGDGTPSTISLTKEEIYSYAYAFIAKTAQISNTSISKENDGFKLVYQLNEESTIFDIETIIDSNFNVKTIVIKLNGVSMTEMSYSYESVPAITWAEN